MADDFQRQEKDTPTVVSTQTEVAHHSSTHSKGQHTDSAEKQCQDSQWIAPEYLRRALELVSTRAPESPLQVYLPTPALLTVFLSLTTIGQC